MIQQSVLIPTVPYSQCTVEEAEELEVTEKGVSLKTYRDHTLDILLQTYLLMQKEYKEQGEQEIYSMLGQAMQQSIATQNCFEIEVCLFAARAIYDGINDIDWNTQTL